MRVTEQLSLWDACRRSRETRRDTENALGPYHCTTEDAERDFDCPKYDDCLSVAATGAWPSFSCTGCRWANTVESCTTLEETA